MSADKPTYKTIAKNKRAFHDYFIDDTLEAGLVLTGTEIKSLRAGKANITESYLSVDERGDIWVNELQIAHYAQGNRFNVPEKRRRKLLLHKREIIRLKATIAKKGYTAVGLELYFKDSFVKLKIGIARGKRMYDHRQDIKTRDAQREMDRVKRGERPQ